MTDSEVHSSSEPEPVLDGLVRAIAAELLQLGYRLGPRPGDVASEARGARAIDPAIWHAMKAIQAGGKP